MRGYAARRVRSAPREDAVTARATILIVDDEPDVREGLDEYFVSHG